MHIMDCKVASSDPNKKKKKKKSFVGVNLQDFVLVNVTGLFVCFGVFLKSPFTSGRNAQSVKTFNTSSINKVFLEWGKDLRTKIQYYCSHSSLKHYSFSLYKNRSLWHPKNKKNKKQHIQVSKNKYFPFDARKRLINSSDQTLIWTDKNIDRHLYMYCTYIRFNVFV